MSNQNDEEFVSFMIEKDDSYMFAPTDGCLFVDNDEDYYRQLSRQFYGSKHQEQNKKQPKSLIEQGFINKRQHKNIGTDKPVFSVSDQLQQIQKLLASGRQKVVQPSSLQNSFKAQQIQQTKMNTIKMAYQQFSKQSNPQRKILIPKQNSRTHRLRMDEGEQFNHLTQNSYRSTLNSSTKSSNKQETHQDLYFPNKMQTDRSVDKQKNFKLSFRNK